MKKAQLLDIVCALTFFAISSSSAQAAVVAVDNTSISGMDRSHTQAFEMYSSLMPDDGLTLDVSVDSGKILPDNNLNFYIHGASSESPYTDSHTNLWLLLIVASVFGIFSEIFHRRPF